MLVYGVIAAADVLLCGKGCSRSLRCIAWYAIDRAIVQIGYMGQFDIDIRRDQILLGVTDYNVCH